MEDKQEMIEELEQDKLEKDRQRIAAIAVLTAVAVVSAFFYVSGFSVTLPDVTDRSMEFDQQIVISESIEPFSTQINSTGVVKFANQRDETVSVDFQTSEIDREMNIPPGGSAYFQASKYSSLPRVNYFSLGSGVSGKIFVN